MMSTTTTRYYIREEKKMDETHFERIKPCERSYRRSDRRKDSKIKATYHDD